MFDLNKIEPVRLAKGAHRTPEKGLCFMEMVAWFEGEEHSDKPACACSVLGRYGIILNDRMPDSARNELLRPLVPLMAGTASEGDRQKRAEFLAMWSVNKVIPLIIREPYATACRDAKTLAEARIAADAAAHAADRKIWPIAVEGLRQAILIGRHDGFTALDETTWTERSDRLLELV